MKKKLIVFACASILLITGFSVYGDQEENVLENSHVENYINETQSMIGHAADSIEEKVMASRDDRDEASNQEAIDLADEQADIAEAAVSQKKSVLEASTLEEAEEDEVQVEPVKEEPVIQESAQEEAAEPIIEEEAIEPEPELVEQAEAIPQYQSFRDIFINEKINVVKNPDTVAEFKAILLYMCETNVLTYTMEYEGISFDELMTAETQAEIAEDFHLVFNQYPEYMSFTNRMTYKATGGTDKVTLTVMLASDTGMDEDTLIRHRDAFFQESLEIVGDLEDAGLLYNGQSDKDKALVLFDWIVQNTEYDNNFAAESYTGYGVYANGLAVCQGYTAAYNALSKCAGLSVEGIGGAADGVDHIWTRALFAGEDIYIDATWGDSYVNSEKVNYDYFLVDGTTLAASHTW